MTAPYPLAPYIACDSRFEALSKEDMVELWDELVYSIAKNGLEHADSYRATDIGRGWETHEAKRTCCGTWEGTHTCKSGITYYIGCNYGH